MHFRFVSLWGEQRGKWGRPRKAKCHSDPCLCRWLREMLIPKGLGAGKKQEFHLEMGNWPWLLSFLAFLLVSSPELMSWVSVVSGFTLPQYKTLLFGCSQPQFNWLCRDTLKFWGLSPGIEDSQELLQQEPGAGSPGEVWIGSKQAEFWLGTCSSLEFRFGFSTGSWGRQKHLWELTDGTDISLTTCPSFIWTFTWQIKLSTSRWFFLQLIALQALFPCRVLLTSY